MRAAPADVVTAVEVAHAAGVSRAAVDALIAAGERRLIPRTRLIAPAEAIRAGVRLRQEAARAAAGVTGTHPQLFATRARRGLLDSPRGALLSATAHALVVLTIVLWRPAVTTTAAAAPPDEAPRYEGL